MFVKSLKKIITREKILVSLTVTLTIFILGTSSVFFTNSREIGIPYGYFLLELLKPFILSNIIIIFILALIPNKIKKPVLGLVLAIGVAFWVQGVFLSSGYGVLDGRTNLDALKTQNIISTVAWIVILLAGIISSKWIDKIVKPVFLIVIFSQVALLIMPAIKVLQQPQQYSDIVKLSIEDMKKQDAFNFSKEKNLIWLVLDSLDYKFLDNALQDDVIANNFKDFTVFSNYASVYSTTIISAPAQFAGKFYDNSVPLRDFIKKSFTSGDSLPERLKEAGYTNRLYMTSASLIYYFSPTLYDNADKRYEGGNNISDVLFASYFRYFPHCLKKYFLVSSSVKAWDFWFLDMIRTKEFTSDSKKPVFFTAHLQGTHLPFVIGEDMTISNSADFKSQTIASLNLVKEFIDKLKSIGVYDNSVIVVTADHGNDDDHRIHTALMIKNTKQVQDKLVLTKKPVSQLDIADNIFRLSNGEYKTAEEFPESINRKHYSYVITSFSSTYADYLKEWSIPNDVADVDNILETGKLFLPKIKKIPNKNLTIDFSKNYEEFKDILVNWEFSDKYILSTGGEQGSTINIAFDDNKREFIKAKIKFNSADKFCKDKKPITIQIFGNKEEFICDDNNTIEAVIYWNNMLVPFIFKEQVKIESIEFLTIDAADGLKYKDGEKIPAVRIPGAFFAKGWWPTENWGRWSATEESVIFLPINKQISSDVGVSLDLRAYFNSKLSSQSLDIVIDDKVLMSADFSVNKNRQKVSFLIPKETVIGKTYIPVVFKLKNAITGPIEDGYADGRKFGIGIHSLKLDILENGSVFKENLGERIPISDIPDIFLKSGWYNIDGGGVWSAVKESEMIIPIDYIKSEDILLSIGLDAYLNDKTPSQIVDIIVKNEVLKTVEFNNKLKKQIVSFIVPKNVIENNLFIPITFRLQNELATPKDNGGIDNRKLGIYIHSIKVEELSFDIFKNNLGKEFVAGNIPDVFFGLGWYRGEPWGRWSAANESDLLLPIGHIQSDYAEVTMGIITYLNSKMTSQTLDIISNGQILKSVNINDNKKHNIRFAITKELTDNNLVIPVTFRLQNDLVSPSEVGKSDTRKLGIALSSIKMDELMIVDVFRDKMGEDISVVNVPNEVFRTGWSAAESWGRWSVAKESEIILHIGDLGAENATVSMNLNAYLNSKLTSQGLDIIIGNTILKSVNFDNKINSQTVTFTVPKELVLGSSILPITFKLKNELASPADEGRGDKRKLGIAITSIKIENDNKATETNINTRQ